MSNQASQLRLGWIFGLVILLHSGVAAAQQGEVQKQTDESKSVAEPTEPLPSYRGEGSFYLGFRYVDLQGSPKAAEYVEDESSVVVGATGIACPLPHRYHFHGEYLSPHDYYGDFGYAYKDLVLFRDVLVGVHHNLGHLNYFLPGDPPVLTYEDWNPGQEYSIDFLKNELSLRLKAPDYPFHTFFQHRYVNRDATIQERFLVGDFSNMTMKSQNREFDWKSNDINLGANSHLGPIEIEYAYSQGEFDPGGNNVLYDLYPPSFIFGRPGDMYPHNVVPETETHGNSLKFHTSYTGQIVASATFSNTENTNTFSNTKAEIWRAAFDLRWIPDPLISVFFKYRHREEDKDNKEQVTLSGMMNHIGYPVRPLVSTKKDLATLYARYKPWSKLTLIGKYDFEQKERKDMDQWEVLPEETTIHRVNLTAHATPMDRLKLKGIYDYQYYENPWYNTEPDYLNRIRLNATYTPYSWITAYIDYTLTLTDREDIRYLNSEPHVVLTGGEREGQKDHFLGSLSFIFSPKATLTASWAYNRWKVEQDLAYSLWNSTGLGGDLPYYDRGVPYTDQANTFTLSMLYMLRQDLTLVADLSYTIAEGEYLPEELIQGDASALASFSSMETTETIVTLELAKKLLEDWEIGLKLYADFYNDSFINDADLHQDGELYTATLTLKRYF